MIDVKVRLNLNKQNYLRSYLQYKIERKVAGRVYMSRRVQPCSQLLFPYPFLRNVEVCRLVVFDIISQEAVNPLSFSLEKVGRYATCDMKNHVINSDMRTGRGAFHHNIYLLKNCFVLVSLLEQVTNYLEILVLNLQVGLFNGAADLVTKHS